MKIKQYQAPLNDIGTKLGLHRNMYGKWLPGQKDFVSHCERCKDLKKYSVMIRTKSGKFIPRVVTCEFCYHRPKS